ncbi:MAG TPA: hypothetical protein VK922_00790 [Gemmatimonadaceae bacterium]|nr:hypothetical protein [Gemmatimonadaceae bacterium]
MLALPVIVLAACTGAPTSSPSNAGDGIAAVKGGGSAPLPGPGRIVYASDLTGDLEI